MTPIHRPRALIIDNDPNMVRLLSRRLSDQGWDSTAAGSYTQALQLFTVGMFDLALIDANLGDAMEGIEAAQIILSLDPELKLAMMSEEASKAELERWFRGPFLEKPLQWSQIEDLLESGSRHAASTMV